MVSLPREDALPGARRTAALGRRPGEHDARGYGHRWRLLRAQILERDVHTCRSCGQPASQVDHVVPKHRGGTDDETNLVSLCRRCHDAKTGREGRLAR
jgi:5-methylcytosine-specific restriction protein A